MPLEPPLDLAGSRQSLLERTTLALGRLDKHYIDAPVESQAIMFRSRVKDVEEFNGILSRAKAELEMATTAMLSAA